MPMISLRLGEYLIFMWQYWSVWVFLLYTERRHNNIVHFSKASSCGVFSIFLKFVKTYSKSSPAYCGLSVSVVRNLDVSITAFGLEIPLFLFGPGFLIWTKCTALKKNHGKIDIVVAHDVIVGAFI